MIEIMNINETMNGKIVPMWWIVLLIKLCFTLQNVSKFKNKQNQKQHSWTNILNEQTYVFMNNNAWTTTEKFMSRHVEHITKQSLWTNTLNNSSKTGLSGQVFWKNKKQTLLPFATVGGERHRIQPYFIAVCANFSIFRYK